MRILKTFLFLAVVAAVAFAGDSVPVYGPARVGVEDPDLLADTVLDVGVLAVSSWDLSRVFIGDGITPGGIEIHPKGCVRTFDDVSTATTNLHMRTYAIDFGPWKMSGDLNEFDFTWGGQKSWVRFVRDTGEAFLAYNFSCTEHDYTFDFAWTGAEGEPLPELQVTTNLLEGFSTAPPNATVYTRPDVSHVRIVYTRDDVPGSIFFRVFANSRMTTGIYFDEPVVATAGIKMGDTTWTEWPDVGAIATNAADAAVSPVAVRVGTLETNAATHATQAELATVAGLAATNAANIATNTANIAANAGNITTNAGNISTNAANIAGLLAALEAATNRIAELEWDTSEYWCKWDANDLSTTQTNWVPTNWPAKRVVLELRGVGSNKVAVIAIRPGWQPPRPCELRIVMPGLVSGSGTFKVQLGKTLFQSASFSASGTSTSFTIYSLYWDPVWKLWTPTKTAFANYWNRFDTNAAVANFCVGNSNFKPVFDVQQ